MTCPVCGIPMKPLFASPCGKADLQIRHYKCLKCKLVLSEKTGKNPEYIAKGTNQRGRRSRTNKVRYVFESERRV